MSDKQITAQQDRSIRGLLTGDSFKQQLTNALPRHLKPERFIRVALTAMTRTPRLKECTQESFFNCLLSLSAAGLEPDGRNAHLIPYGKVCTLIIDYKGMVELVQRSGKVSYVHADVVCENDVFDYNKGNLEKHTIDFKSDRGKPYAFYALARFKDGSEKCDVMTIEEVKAIQKRSRSGGNGPWVTDFNEMAKKTVFRRLSKWLPLSAEIKEVIEADMRHEFDGVRNTKQAEVVTPVLGDEKYADNDNDDEIPMEAEEPEESAE
jgi:recombination protein RecT